jgi:hypothetical protein
MLLIVLYSNVPGGTKRAPGDPSKYPGRPWTYGLFAITSELHPFVVFLRNEIGTIAKHSFPLEEK